MPNPSVALICGSRSDFATLEAGGAILDELGVAHELRVISAHRAPALLDEYITDAETRGVRVFICAAGLAAHLAGAVAARSPWPVIGVPMPGGVSDGLDALLSTVQMPKGVPVATVGVGRADNAAILAAQVLAVADAGLAKRIVDYRTAQTQKILDDPTNQPSA
jgi:5-(carboxyamino)imidazole ribonucleotide mutase